MFNSLPAETKVSDGSPLATASLFASKDVASCTASYPRKACFTAKVIAEDKSIGVISTVK